METLEKGFLINVFSQKDCPGLLVTILEAFEELGLDVLDASVSCSDNFRLEAVGGEVRNFSSIYFYFCFSLYSSFPTLVSFGFIFHMEHTLLLVFMV